MISKILSKSRYCLWLLLVLAFLPTVPAESPRSHTTTCPTTPITIDAKLSHTPEYDQSVLLTVTVRSLLDAPNTIVDLILPAGVFADSTSWTLDLRANESKTVTTELVFTREVQLGNLGIDVRALKAIAPDVAWGDMKTLRFHASPERIATDWKVDIVPVAELTEPGDTLPLSMEPTPWRWAEDAETPLLPAADPEQDAQIAEMATTSPGMVTLQGTWMYYDRGGVSRPIAQQQIEIRRGDGSQIGTGLFPCMTGTSGTFTCTFTHPGSSMRIWIRSFTKFKYAVVGGPSQTDRLGVFSGPEVTGGCGSDAIRCSYFASTGTISCPDGGTCNVGTSTVTTSMGEILLGAHQMTQDLIRSWRKFFQDTNMRHPVSITTVTAGPARITYPVPTNHGTHAHVPPADGWISVEPPSQKSADVVVHEYGHVVMAKLYAGGSPSFPTSDCPATHSINMASGPGCALSEGWANFWAWYSNQVYDGDNVTTNDGPVFNLPGGASNNLETRDNNTFDSGDTVEGNVAGALGDIFDATNDNKPGDGIDQISDGIKHIWHTTFDINASNFAQWWNGWKSLGHTQCDPVRALWNNTINYTPPSGCKVNF